MIDVLKPLIQQFMPFAQQQMGFSRPPRLFLRQDTQNASNPLGKTGFYDPQAESITLYTTGRHPKDIMRSLAHELQHHTQKCNGDFDNVTSMGEQGYAQADPHMRTMEIEAYKASIVFRDWEDSLKETIYYEHLQKGDKSSMSTKKWKNGELKSLLSEAWGFKMDLSKLNESQNPMDPDYYDAEEEQRKIDKRKGRGHRTKENPRGGDTARKEMEEGRTGSGVDHGGDDDAEAKEETEGTADSAREEEGLAAARKQRKEREAHQRSIRGLEEGDEEGLDERRADDMRSRRDKMAKADSGPGRQFGSPDEEEEDSEVLPDDDSDDAVQRRGRASRGHRPDRMEEDGAKRKGDPRLRRPDADRLRENVVKLHKAGLSKVQIKEFLSAAFSKTLKD